MDTLDTWTKTIREENAAFRAKTGAIKLAIFRALSCLLAMPSPDISKGGGASES